MLHFLIKGVKIASEAEGKNCSLKVWMRLEKERWRRI